MINETDLLNYINKCEHNLHLVKHDGNYYHTTKDMFNKGIKVCNSCGKFMPLEKAFCKCGEEVFVLFEIPKEEQLKIEAALNANSPKAKAKLKKSDELKYKFVGLNKETLKYEDITELISHNESMLFFKSQIESCKQTHAKIYRVNITKRNKGTEIV